MKVHAYTITVPGVTSYAMWLGGEAKPSAREGYLWLTQPNGDLKVQVPAQCVTEITIAEWAERLLHEDRMRKAPLN